MKLVLDKQGRARAYAVSDSGALSIVWVTVIDGQPVYGRFGEGVYDLSGPVVDLMGWPDTKAVDCGHTLIAIAD